MLCAALACGALSGVASAQLKVFKLPPFNDPNLTRHGDPAAANGDRHDVDPGYPGSASKGPQMSVAVSDALRAALFAARQKDWDTAKGKLIEARLASKLTDFDAFEIAVASGYVSLNTGDHAGALQSYRKVIASPFFTTQTARERDATLRNAMILSNESHDYPGAIALGTQLASAGPLDETAAVAFATAYFGDKNYEAARTIAQKTLDAEVAAGASPNASAVQIVAQSETNLHYADAETPATAKVAERGTATLR
jgi:tetratricopeptide (TPR) repeat protein